MANVNPIIATTGENPSTDGSVILLTKDCDQQTLIKYFNYIHELAKSGEDFPVNLDSVWPIVYPRKDHAVRELKKNYLQSVDYQIFPKNAENKIISPKNVENSKVGRKSEYYYLSIPCLEFFIAHRVREVFEVYRKVFHLVVEKAESVNEVFHNILREALPNYTQEQLMDVHQAADVVVSSSNAQVKFYKDAFAQANEIIKQKDQELANAYDEIERDENIIYGLKGEIAKLKSKVS